MKDKTYALAFLQINKMSQMSMGKYLNMIIDEYVLEKAENDGTNLNDNSLLERCFLCGHKATWRANLYNSVFMCEAHFRFFKSKYNSYVKGFKNLEENKK